MVKSLKSILIFVATIAILIFSCNEPTLIGGEIIPEEDGIETIFTDTFTINLKVVEEDSVRTDELGVYLIGGMESQTFGNVYSDLYSQVRIPSNNLDFGENSIADSIFLNLDYSTVFGDSMLKQTLIVYELLNDIAIEEEYYSNDKPMYDVNEELGRFDTVHSFSYTDSITFGGVQTTPILRIKLDKSLAQKFIDADESVFENNNNFLDFFKGFYVKYEETTSENNLMVLYNLFSTASNITMYYRTFDSLGVANDTLSQTFIINANSESVANYTNNFDGSTASETFNEIDEPELFLHNLGGYILNLEIPHLKTLENAVINQAKISMVRFKEENEDSLFIAPLGVAFQYRDDEDSTGFSFLNVDDVSTIAFEFGGDLETFTAEDGTELERYEFNCALFLNRILSGEIENPEMYIVPLAKRNAPYRTRVAGTTHPQYPTKLKIIYSVLK